MDYQPHFSRLITGPLLPPTFSPIEISLSMLASGIMTQAMNQWLSGVVCKYSVRIITDKAQDEGTK